MFEPYKYRKDYYYKYPAKGKNTVSNNPLGGLNFVSLGKFASQSFIAGIFISIGAIILASKVLLPTVKIYATIDEYSPVISPLASPDKTSTVTKGIDQDDSYFVFKELAPGFRQYEYIEENGVEHLVNDGLRESSSTEQKYFYLTIPKLGIDKAKVKINSNNLDPKEFLGHYDRTCLPGEGCNTFIYGHSSIDGYESRHEDGDYTRVFTKLGELKYGDEFMIEFDSDNDGVAEEFRYLVDLTKVSAPEDINPLADPYPKTMGIHENTVELFTCTPPGTTKFRLSVVGKLIE